MSKFRKNTKKKRNRKWNRNKDKKRDRASKRARCRNTYLRKKSSHNVTYKVSGTYGTSEVSGTYGTSEVSGNYITSFTSEVFNHVVTTAGISCHAPTTWLESQLSDNDGEGYPNDSLKTLKVSGHDATSYAVGEGYQIDDLETFKVSDHDATSYAAGGGASSTMPNLFRPSLIPGLPPLDMSIDNVEGIHEWGTSMPVRYTHAISYRPSHCPDAHWGIPGCLMVGPCPVPDKTTSDNKEMVKDYTRKFIRRILRHDITTFASLMLECDDINGDEDSKYRPYSRLDLHEIAPDAKFIKLGIRDYDITDYEYVLEFARQIVTLLEHGENIYLHCWGGHGRAGTVYCLVIHLIYGLTAKEALDHCQRVHDCREEFLACPSPQIPKQADQVIRIIDYLQQGGK